MKQTKKLSLSLNKEVIDQLDKHQASQVMGGVDVLQPIDPTAPIDPTDPGLGGFLSVLGSRCRATNPLRNNCCIGDSVLYSTGALGGCPTEPRPVNPPISIVP